MTTPIEVAANVFVVREAIAAARVRVHPAEWRDNRFTDPSAGQYLVPGWVVLEVVPIMGPREWVEIYRWTLSNEPHARSVLDEILGVFREP